jgi:hypothetical protein
MEAAGGCPEGERRAQADEGPHQLGRISVPEGEETPHPDLAEVALAIGAQVREEDVLSWNGWGDASHCGTRAS